MSYQPTRETLFRVLLSTRPQRDTSVRPFVVAAVGHAVVAAALILTVEARPREVPPFRESTNLDDPPILIQFADAAVARGGSARSATRARTVSSGRAAKPAALPLALPDLREAETALSLASAAFDREFMNGTGMWAMPRVPTREQLETELPYLSKAPRITTYSRAPTLVNRKDIERFLSRKFPFRLRQLGGEARAMLWLLVDITGRVHKAQVGQTSGRIDVDSVALAATHKMQFRPAENAGRIVPVWVQMPVGFRVIDE